MTKFLQDLLFKGALTVDGVVTLTNNTQIGNSRLDVHNIYGAITLGNGSTGTDITALTVKAMGTGASKNFRVLNTNGDGEVFATQENAFVLIGGNVIPTNNRTGFTFDAFGVSPVAFNIVSRSNNTGGIFRGLYVTEGNLNGLSGGTFDSRYVEVAPLFNATSGSEYIVRGFYYNPTITNLAASSVIHYAFESTAGKIKVSDLAGTGTRMVVADSTGVLSTQSMPAGSLQGSVDADKSTSGSLSIGTTIVKSVSATTYSGVFFDYVVKNGTNVRVGSVVAISNGTNVEFYETLSNDIGATTNLTFTVTLGSGNINLNAVAAATGWTVIVSTRAI
jgi:hypothetical protein